MYIYICPRLFNTIDTIQILKLFTNILRVKVVGTPLRYVIFLFICRPGLTSLCSSSLSFSRADRSLPLWCHMLVLLRADLSPSLHISCCPWCRDHRPSLGVIGGDEEWGRWHLWSFMVANCVVCRSVRHPAVQSWIGLKLPTLCLFKPDDCWACSSLSSSSYVERIFSTILMNSFRLDFACLSNLGLALYLSDRLSKGGPHRISSTFPTFGGLLKIAVIQLRSSVHLGHSNIVCSAVSSGSRHYLQ